MPTATTISQYPLVNLGPLTTTFTAPSSCATATASRFGLGVSVAPFWGSLRSEQCGPEQQLYTGSDTACFPSASARNDIFLSAQNRPWENYPVRYHFPGNACPSGWTTALAMTAGGTTSFEYDAAISSVFFSPQTYYSRHHDGAILMGGLPAVSILGDALAPGETAVGCCPRQVARLLLMRETRLTTTPADIPPSPTAFATAAPPSRCTRPRRPARSTLRRLTTACERPGPRSSPSMARR